MSVSDWVDLDDNRIGPLLKELATAIEESDDLDTLTRVARRLKFMSGSIETLRYYKEKEQR